MKKKLLFEEYLIEKKILTDEEMINALQYQRDHTPFFEDIALKMNLLNKRQLCEIMASLIDSKLHPPEVARSKGFLSAVECEQIEKEAEAKKVPIEDIIIKLNNIEPDVLKKVKKDYEEEIKEYLDIRDILRNINIFKTLDDPDREALAYIAQKKAYNAEKRIVTEGEVANCFYSVVSGALRVSKKNPKKKGKDVYITTIEANDVFGESSIFEKGVRTANVDSEFETVLLRFDKKPFFKFLKEHPQAALQILVFIIQRLINKMSITNAELAFERKDFASQEDIDTWMKEFGII